MLIGRTAELEYLKGYYEKAGSYLLILYGQKCIGKTAILREFTRGKPCHYHMARACSEKEHLEQLQELAKRETDSSGEKQIVIVEEFQRMVRSGKAVTEALFGLYCKDRESLLIFVSSSISWVENHMVSKIGDEGRKISGVLKIKELEFRYLREFFPSYSVRQCMEVYAMLGGIAGWWRCFLNGSSVKENVCRAMLEESGSLYRAAESLMLEELREPAVYNTILAALASGKEKLNELYLYTGFSRAKLSVYLGNLIEMNLVEKVFSFESSERDGKGSSGRNGAKKGIYRISSSFVRFYYTYLYASADKRFRMSPERYYNTYILPDRDRYMQDAFRKICMQHVEAHMERGELPVKAERIGSWFGKTGSIDIVLQDEEGKTLLGLCRASRMGMDYEAYRGLLETAGKAGFRTDYIWLYAELFDERIVRAAEESRNLTLIDIREL